MKTQRLISSFSNKERTEFLSLLNSGFWGAKPLHHKMAIACFELEDKHRITVKSKPPNTEVEIWNKKDLSLLLYPEAKPSDKEDYIRSQLSKLTGFLKNYFAQKALLKDERSFSHMYARALSSRGLDVDFLQFHKHETEKYTYDKVDDFDSIFSPIYLDKEKIDLVERVSLNLPNNFAQRSLNVLDRAYIIKKLSLLCVANSQDCGSEDKHNVFFIDQLKQMIAAKKFEKDKLIQLYFYFFQITLNPSKESDAIFFQAKEAYFELLPGLKRWHDQVEVRNMFKYLVNFCVYRINQKAREFVNVCVSLYDIVLGQGIVENGKGKLEPNYFKNIFSLFLDLGSHEKASEFLHHYKGEIIGDKNQAKALAFLCNSMYSFRIKEFEKAYEESEKALNLIETNSNFQLELETKALRIRAAYMLQDREFVEIQSKALIGLAKRKTGLEKQKQLSFGTFAAYQLALGRLAFSKRTAASEKLIKLKEKLEQEAHSFYGKNWLIFELKKLV